MSGKVAGQDRLRTGKRLSNVHVLIRMFCMPCSCGQTITGSAGSSTTEEELFQLQAGTSKQERRPEWWHAGLSARG